MLFVSKSSSRSCVESSIILSRQFEVIDGRVAQLAADFQNACQRPDHRGPARASRAGWLIGMATSVLFPLPLGEG